MKKTNIIALSVAAFALSSSLATAALVKGYEFDTDAEGFNANNSSALTVTGGILSGVASSGDIQLTNNPNITPTSGQTWSTIVFRVRETNEDPVVVTPFSQTGVLVALGPNAGGAGSTVFSSGFTSTDAGDGFLEVTANISGYGVATINYFRIDPVGGPDAAGNTYEVDYIRINAVPEPSSAALLGLGGLALILRRRK